MTIPPIKNVHDHPRLRRAVKRATSRRVRRLGRRYLDDAPPRVTKGYAD